MSSKNYKLTNEQMEDLKAAFQLFDRDKNGCITVDEIGMVLQTFGHFYEKSDVIEMVQAVDKNGNGCIEFDEFVEFMTPQMNPNIDEEEFKNLFKLMDQDGNGRLSKEEIKSCFKNYHQELNEYELDDLFEKVDQDQDGEIDFYGFMQIINNSF